MFYRKPKKSRIRIFRWYINPIDLGVILFLVSIAIPLCFFGYNMANRDKVQVAQEQKMCIYRLQLLQQHYDNLQIRHTDLQKEYVNIKEENKKLEWNRDKFEWELGTEREQREIFFQKNAKLKLRKRWEKMFGD